MKLDQLLANIDVLSRSGDGQVDVTGVQYDSRRVEPGFVFVAVRGERVDGNDFVDAALERGAAAIVSEAAPIGSAPWVRVRSDRRALAALAASYFGRPTDQLKLVGITGTNGKTTTAYLVESIVRAAGYPVARLGTTDHRGPGFRQGAKLTTPEAPDLEQMFRSTVDTGCGHAVMEVSSHAIALKRVEGLSFDVVAFTNLSAEHLDFHGGMEDYFSVKQRLFTGLQGVPPPAAVLNRDDRYFEALSESGNSTCLSFGMTSDADIFPKEFSFGWHGLTAEFETPRGVVDLKSELMGRLNLYNVAAAVGIGIALELPTLSIVDGVEALRNVPGRFEFVDHGQRFRVIVDYAHTGDALRKALTAAREITEGKLIVVFGAGGDRDSSKRREMGAVAASCSDFAVLTSDNPRSEDPLGIIGMIAKGFPAKGKRYTSVPDRREAIRLAIGRAEKRDTVVIAGKGHEAYQVVGDVQLPFDDRVVVGELLDELNSR